MKFSLVVLTPGKSQGQEIPITLPQFIIGRDARCNLRPASPIISKKHCAVFLRGNQAFVQDFNSTNGTLVNDVRVEGERELHHDDRLSVGPLQFGVRLEISTPVDKPTPMPPIRAAAPKAEDEEAAALLLAMSDTDTAVVGTSVLDDQGVPTGSTVMELGAAPSGDTQDGEEAKGGAVRSEQAVKAEANTSAAAKALLEKYLRRPRF
jgi:pSer/pThr/pTyr-binding forkhead associated (FHA) protein